MIFDLIFVRHGLSCANVWQNKWYGSQIFYYDPELSQTGINISQSLSPTLQERINAHWFKEPYTIAASRMIRAQETAFYMLAESTNKPISVFPHIGESGLTRDNWSLSIPEQREIINSRNPAICRALDKAHDYREPQTHTSKSNWTKFMHWAVANPDAFAQGSDKKYRAVIFSHGNFLQSVFPIIGKDRMNNNDALITEINVGKNYVNPSFTYLPLNAADPKNSICPDECRYTVCTRPSNRDEYIVNTTVPVRKSHRSIGAYSKNKAPRYGGKQTRRTKNILTRK